MSSDPTSTSTSTSTTTSSTKINAPALAAAPVPVSKGALMTNCILESSFFFALGIGAGVFYAVKKKNAKMFFATVSIGTALDFMYGYNVKCKTLVDDYNQSKAAAASATVVRSNTDNDH